MAAEPWRTVGLYLLLLRASMRSAVQYRFNTLIGIIAGAVYQGSGFAFIWVVMTSFPTLGSWSLAEIAFLYGLRLTAHALWLIPLSGLIGIEWIVRDGEFDRFLLRPLNPLVQLLAKDIGLGQVGDLLVGLTLLIIAGQQAGVSWGPGLIVFCLASIVGGALVEASFFLALASLTLRMFHTFTLRIFIDDVFSRFGSYPMQIFGAPVQWVLTFVLPAAFVAYIPASVVLDKTATLNVEPVIAYASPLLGVVLFALACLFWGRQVRHYQSVGH
ncbi:ABC transporter permease [Nonomuraea sp. NPDC050547]|uniref:ABC transporter permease n=1 Tax=unclassified Nonomuraea TaxID=2593643 RepID=UPI0037B0A7AB